MPRLLRQCIAFGLAALQLSAFSPQSVPAPPLSPAAQQQKDRIAKIGIGNKLSVRTTNGTEYHGRLESLAPETFSIQEVDLKQVETVRYSDVVKSYKNYGGKGFGGRRVNPKTNLITASVLAGVFIVIFIVAISQLKKA